VDDLGPFNTELHLRKTNFQYSFDGKKDKYHELVKALIHDTDRNQLIVDDLKKYYLQGLIVICYSSRIEHMEILETMFKAQMPDASTDILASRKYGNVLRIKDQNDIKDRLKRQEIQVLNGGKIVEQGFDCPPLSVAVLATPTKSKRLIEQVLGRCQREFPGKSRAILVDYVDEKTKILLWQFFAKNRKLYKDFVKVWI
jgi:superfamily II DNA or RNA helicase